MLQNVQESYFGNECRATRQGKLGSEPQEQPDRTDKLCVTLSVGSGYTESMVAASVETLEGLW
jgi:hypothetical protein